MVATDIISEEIKRSQLFFKKQHKYLYIEEKNTHLVIADYSFENICIFDCDNATAWILNEED